MLSRLPAVLLLALAACASHEGPSTPTPTPTPTPRAEITVAISSVQLAQDCPDPATDATATATAPAQPYAPPPPAAAQEPAPDAQGSMKEPPPAAARMTAAAAKAYPGGGWSPPCVQSTMQLSLANTGDRQGKLEIKKVRLFDVESKRELAPIVARKPSEWNAEGTYRPWNEEVAAKTTAKAAYRLGEPDWGQVQSTLGTTVDLYARPFVLELEVAVDGRVQTVRSPEFTREQIHMVVT